MAKSSQAHYWAVGNQRKREGRFKDNFDKFLSGVENGNQAKVARSIQRIEITIAHIKKAGIESPKTVTAFVSLMIKTSKQLFEVGIGKATLYKKANILIWKTADAELLAAQEAISPVVNHEVNGPLEQVEDLPETSAKIAENPLKHEEFRSCPKKPKSKRPKRLINKESSDLTLYGGFGEGEARGESNLKNILSSSNLISCPITNSPITKAERKQSEKERHRAEVMAQQESYYTQLQKRHRAIKELEDQRKTPEYQQAAKSSFAAIRKILGIN